MIWTIIGIILLLWLVGFIAHLGGDLIHILLIIALVVFIYDRLQGRKAA